MRKIKLLHITDDNKFFDGKLKVFSSDDRIENIAYSTLYGVSHFQYIKSVDCINVLSSKEELKQILEIGDYDVVYFYSLYVENWWMIEAIPKDKIIIWWAWGYDIYYSQGSLKPFVEVSLYQPLSYKYYCLHPRKIFKPIFEYLKYWPQRNELKRLKNYILQRVDYLMPVVPMDYELLKLHPDFKAQVFYSKTLIDNYKFEKKKRSENGPVLLGNSATLPNNHLDILSLIRRRGIQNRMFIIPLSYGDDNYGNYLKKHINAGDNNVKVLENFISKEEYFSIVDNCTYAIFGIMRQQAMGNVSKCIREGIKVFLYKDSIPYRSLISRGYKVFAIEDITEKSLSTPLSMEDNEHNNYIFLKECKSKNLIYEDVISKIYKNVNIEL